MSEWISVKDRLPKADGTTLYLVYNQQWKYSDPIIVIGRLNEWGWHYGCHSTENIIQGKVTHWIPLPEPPTDNRKG